MPRDVFETVVTTIALSARDFKENFQSYGGGVGATREKNRAAYDRAFAEKTALIEKRLGNVF